LIASLAFVAFLFAMPAVAQDCPELVGTLPGNYWRAIAVSGDYAYLGGDVFRVIDVSNPSAPVEVGFIDLPGAYWDVAVEGAYAYVGSFSSPFGLGVIDVTWPTAPAEVGFVPTPDSALGVAVSQGFAYVANGMGGLRVIDVTTPALPFEVSFLDPPGYEWDVAVAAGYAYLMAEDLNSPYNRWGRLSVIDVSTPSSPVEVGFVEGPGSDGVAVSDGYAYVTRSYPHEGPDPMMGVIDVSNPSVPVEVGYLGMPNPLGVAVSGDYAYVADSGYANEPGRLSVIDVSTPSAPVEVGFYQSQASGVAVSDGYVFLVADGGLYVFRECPFFSDGFESGDTSAWSATVP
jgi:hypothetical protein